MRRREVTQEVVSSRTNIPCIAFCNTGDDPDGRWLLATDIVGDTHAIDLLNVRKAQQFTFSPTLPGITHDPDHAGWQVMFLDQRSFIHVETFGHPCGTVDYSMGMQLWDATLSTQGTAPGHQRKFGGSNHGPDYEMPPYRIHGEKALMGYNFTFPVKENPEAEYCGDLPCPTLHASVRNVHLLQPAGGPLIVLDDVLRQPIEDHSAGLDSYERLNMHAYIPSIGVVILASQKGRAMVIGLNKISFDEIPCLDNTAYSMRVDCILPFPDQDQNGDRPFMPLLGIAVGPIQGTERRSEGERRWRLMMTYYDHTVLSYEIRRGIGGDAVKVDDVVV